MHGLYLALGQLLIWFRTCGWILNWLLLILVHRTSPYIACNSTSEPTYACKPLNISLELWKLVASSLGIYYLDHYWEYYLGSPFEMVISSCQPMPSSQSKSTKYKTWTFDSVCCYKSFFPPPRIRCGQPCWAELLWQSYCKRRAVSQHSWRCTQQPAEGCTSLTATFGCCHLYYCDISWEPYGDALICFQGLLFNLHGVQRARVAMFTGNMT